MEFDEIYETDYPPLSMAIVTGNVVEFNKHLKSRTGINSKDNRGRIPLHEAAEYDREDFVNELLKFGKDSVNCQSYEGETPLFIACKFHDNVSLVRAVVAAGGDINLGNNEGVTPLHIACGLNHCKVAAALIGLGADVNAKDMNEFTPLHTAVENNIDFVSHLVSEGADPSSQDIFGRTALFLAAQYADIAVIRSLLQAKSDVNMPAYDGVTPLMMAAQRGVPEHVDLLLEYGADPDIEANDNLMALHLALGRSGHEPVVKRILEVTNSTIISANIKKVPDYSPVFLALENDTLSYLRLLLESKQDLQTIFQPLRITEHICDEGLFSFECCEVVMNAKFTTVSFLAYFLCRFHATHSFDEMLEYVLDHGCPILVDDKKCFPPILAAVHLPGAEVAMKCINIFAMYGVDFDYSSSGTACPDVLISALKHSDAEVILCVLQLTSFATLDDIVCLAIKGSCRVNKVIPLVELLGGVSPSVFTTVSAVDSPTRSALQLFTPSVCSLQTLCRTTLRKHFFERYRSSHIDKICQEFQIPKLLVSYLKYETCRFPAV